MSAYYTDSNVIMIDFVDDSWSTAFPDIYTVTNNNSKPWFSSDTFKYNENSTLRSGNIGNSATTSISIKFVLLEAGSVEFNWAVSSENNYDKLIVNLDNNSILTKSGSQSTFTVYTAQLTEGEHIITFTYSKDSSSSSGLDAAAIGYLKLVGVVPNFDEYYLVYDNTQNKYYAVIDNSLTEVSITDMPTLQDFIDKGGPKPMDSMLLNMNNFRILKCSNTTEIDRVNSLQYSIKANVKPQLLRITQEIKLDKQYQVGFSSISLVIYKKESTEFKLILSPNGTTWYSYSNSEWIEVNYDAESALQFGMNQEVIATLNEEIFSALYAEHDTKQMYLAFIIQCSELDDWLIKSISVGYKLAQQGGN